jgi:hypothetical protein
MYSGTVFSGNVLELADEHDLGYGGGVVGALLHGKALFCSLVRSNHVFIFNDYATLLL